MFFPSTATSPLHMRGVNNTTGEVVEANLDATFARGYKPFGVTTEHKGPVSIVGAGPSLSWTYQDIVGDVIACNSAQDFLIGKGVIPKYAMMWDAHPIMEGIFTPDKRVTYLIASRCHPSVFEKLEGFDVIVWHAMGGDGVERRLIERNWNEPMVFGGSTSVTRAMHLAGHMGYKEMHLFGIDSCYAEGRTHVNGSIIAQERINLRVCGKWFVVAPWMGLQAGDFKTLAPIFQAHGVRLVVHGTGLIPYTATFMGIETPDIKVGLAEKIKRWLHASILLFLELKNSPQLLGGSNARK